MPDPTGAMTPASHRRPERRYPSQHMKPVKGGGMQGHSDLGDLLRVVERGYGESPRIRSNRELRGK